ncbi:hypothetical protein I350_04017 [Cryptococcus amylolentus CBS 6273]|uniref:Uncharacterized protein n=1 Tax=Cryptococcus amylolentus CBS 6273 TaxID=1296118 RepID=A0A1E3K0R5_9TREE|nr:hypothetical protein I350_04017 [Cryptococcus amylolentus CBS 6273]
MSRGYREACNYSKYAQFDFHDQSPKTQALREQKALQKKALETERVKAGGRAAVPAGDEGNKRGKTGDDSGGRSGGKTDYGDRWKDSGSEGFHFNHQSRRVRLEGLGA